MQLSPSNEDQCRAEQLLVEKEGQGEEIILILQRKGKMSHFLKRFCVEVITDNWTQKFEPHGGQISKP